MYPESAKIFQYRGMDFDGFRVVRVKVFSPLSFNKENCNRKFTHNYPNGGRGGGGIYVPIYAPISHQCINYMYTTTCKFACVM